MVGILPPAEAQCVRAAIQELRFPRFADPKLDVSFTFGADAAPAQDAGGPTRLPPDPFSGAATTRDAGTIQGPQDGTRIITTYGRQP